MSLLDGSYWSQPPERKYYIGEHLHEEHLLLRMNVASVRTVYECVGVGIMHIQFRIRWQLLRIVAVWLCWQNCVVGQFFSNFFPRSYGPSPYDYYHHKPAYQSPPGHPSVNFINPYLQKPKMPFSQLPSQKDYMFSGPPLANFKGPNESLPQRDHRFLSLFTVVQFPRDSCTTAAGDNGTCLSVQDCQRKGGIAAGACANNFGVCCVFMASCGETTRENGTYFVNKGYPSGFNGTTSCQLTIDKLSPEVCQYRLDFEQFSLAGPEPINHICNYDQFIVSGSSTVPIICGINSGNHMYLEAGPGMSGPVVLSITTSGAEISRYWKIRITQIPCPSNMKADDGCLQYFTGISGTIKSFNYEPTIGLHLSNQDYSICIRTERNFCSIQYSQCVDTANNRSHSFTLTGNTLGQNAVQSMADSNNCNTDWLMIPCVENVNTLLPRSSNCVDRLCGGTLSADPSTTSSTITSNIRPFRMYFHSNSVESPDMGNIGFCLHYVQQPCNNKP